MSNWDPYGGDREPGKARGRPSKIDDAFQSFRREMDRLFGDWAERWPFGAAAPGTLAPQIDVKETAEALEVRADVPGIERDKLNAELHDGRLTISGERSEEKATDEENLHVRERSYGSFRRDIPIPFKADPDAVRASYADGVLTVTVPKPPEMKTEARKIKIDG